MPRAKKVATNKTLSPSSSAEETSPAIERLDSGLANASETTAVPGPPKKTPKKRKLTPSKATQEPQDPPAPKAKKVANAKKGARYGSHAHAPAIPKRPRVRGTFGANDAQEEKADYLPPDPLVDWLQRQSEQAQRDVNRAVALASRAALDKDKKGLLSHQIGRPGAEDAFWPSRGVFAFELAVHRCFPSLSARAAGAT